MEPSGPDAGEARACIRLNCPRRGEPTTAQRCPNCDFPTRPMAEVRPDPTPAQLAAENLLGPGLPPRPSMLCVTTNDLPGYRVTTVLGECWGLTVRARDWFGNVSASFRTYSGGEVPEYTRLLTEARLQALERMLAHAAQLGGNAVLAMRFDANEIAGVMTEVLAYGTAVRVERQPG